jgi:hypothetical protein
LKTFRIDFPPRPIGQRLPIRPQDQPDRSCS